MNTQPIKIEELDEAELHRVANMQVGKAAVLFTTPFCGTCKVAMKMLEIVAATNNVSYRLYTTNINFTPYFRQHWQIKSVPALAIIENGSLVKMIFAMGSVSELYAHLK